MASFHRITDYRSYDRQTVFSPPFQEHPQQHSPSNTNLSILGIAIIGILTTAFLLVGYYVFVIKCCLNWHRFSHRFQFLRSFSDPRTRNLADPLVFFTSPTASRGLDEWAIRAIPIFHFKKEGTKDPNDCPVCLNEFRDEERLRILPNCAHLFHIDCIDTWLQTNSNCPVCRSNIANQTEFITIEITNPAPDQTNDRLADETETNDQNSRYIQMGNQSESKTHLSPGPRKFEQGLEQRFVNQKSPFSSLKPSKFHRHAKRSSMGDEWIDVREKDEQFSIQPIRRSFSMDSSADRELYKAVQEILAQKPQLHEISSREGCSSSSRFRRSLFSFGSGRGS